MLGDIQVSTSGTVSKFRWEQAAHSWQFQKFNDLNFSFTDVKMAGGSSFLCVVNGRKGSVAASHQRQQTAKSGHSSEIPEIAKGANFVLDDIYTSAQLKRGFTPFLRAKDSTIAVKFD